MKKIISIILMITIIITSVNIPTVNAAMLGDEQIVYVDGIGYTVQISNNGLLYDIQALDNANYNAVFKFYVNGASDVTVSEGNETKNYALDIRELNSEKIDIDVYKSDVAVDFDNEQISTNILKNNSSLITSNEMENGSIYQVKNKNFKSNDFIENYDDITKLGFDSYEGQIPFVTALVYSILQALEIILLVASLIVVGTATMLEIGQVITDIKASTKKRNTIYPAAAQGPAVYINYATPFETTQAAGSMISLGASVYSWSGVMAKAAVDVSGLKCSIKPEMDTDMKEGWIYYEHWYPIIRNGAHAWFGRAYTK